MEAACKWYSEADAGPGAEAGAGFHDYKNSFGSICGLQHRCGRVQAEFTSTTLDKAYKHW